MTVGVINLSTNILYKKAGLFAVSVLNYFLRKLFTKWISRNVSLITNSPRAFLGQF